MLLASRAVCKNDAEAKYKQNMHDEHARYGKPVNSNIIILYISISRII